MALWWLTRHYSSDDRDLWVTIARATQSCYEAGINTKAEVLAHYDKVCTSKSAPFDVNNDITPDDSLSVSFFPWGDDEFPFGGLF